MFMSLTEKLWILMTSGEKESVCFKGVAPSELAMLYGWPTHRSI